MATQANTIGALIETYSRINTIRDTISRGDYKTELDRERYNEEITNIELERDQIDANIKLRKKKEKKQLKKIFNGHINRPKKRNLCQKDCCKDTKYYHNELKGGFNEPKLNLKKLGSSGFAWAWAEKLNPPYARIYL